MTADTKESKDFALPPEKIDGQAGTGDSKTPEAALVPCDICCSKLHATADHAFDPKTSRRDIEALFKLNRAAPMACVEHFVLTEQLSLIPLLVGKTPWGSALVEMIDRSDLDLGSETSKKRNHYGTWQYAFPCRLADYIRCKFDALVEEAERTGDDAILGRLFHLASLCELTKAILDFGRKRLKQSLRPRFAVLRHVARHCVDRFRQKSYTLDFLRSCLSFALNRRAELKSRETGILGNNLRRSQETKGDSKGASVIVTNSKGVLSGLDGTISGLAPAHGETKALKVNKGGVRSNEKKSSSDDLIAACASSLCWLICTHLRPSLAFKGAVYQPIVFQLLQVDELRQETERLLEDSDRLGRRDNSFQMGNHGSLYSLQEYGKVASQLTWCLGSNQQEHKHPTVGQLVLWDKLLWHINYDRDRVSAEDQVAFRFGDVMEVIELLQTDGVPGMFVSRLRRAFVDEIDGGGFKYLIMCCFDKDKTVKVYDETQVCLESQYKFPPDAVVTRHLHRKRHLAGMCACKCCCFKHYLERCPDQVRLNRFNYDNTPDSAEDQAEAAEFSESSEGEGEGDEGDESSENGDDTDEDAADGDGHGHGDEDQT